MDEKARGEAVAESTKRLGEESLLLRSKNEYPSAEDGQSGTPVPTNARYAVAFQAEMCYNKRRKAVGI